MILLLLFPAVFLKMNSGYEFTGFAVLSTYLLFPYHPMINGVSWSLSYEIYFYLLFALLLKQFILINLFTEEKRNIGFVFQRHLSLIHIH